MENTKIEIEKDALLAAYKNGDKNVKNTLENLYGKEMFQAAVMNRVKTFEDAIKELGENNPLVKQYRCWVKNGPNYDSPEIYRSENDLLAFLKLRIITAALNEGWKFTFENGKYVYYNVDYNFYTREELNLLNMARNANVLWTKNYQPKNDVLTAGIPNIITHIGRFDEKHTTNVNLCFKTKELAEYASKQFFDNYFNYFIGGNE